MSHKVFTMVAVLVCLTFGMSLIAPVAAAKHDKRRPEPPCPPPPPCAKPKADKNYEIRITSIDAGAAALSTIETVLASTSNRDDQFSRLQAQIKIGVPICHVAYGPSVRVPQDESRISKDQPEVSPDQPNADNSLADRCRVTAQPHLNAHYAEVVDVVVEQSRDAKSTLTAAASLVFENGDTKLLSRTLRQDGTYHLVYATVFFPPPPCPASVPR